MAGGCRNKWVGGWGVAGSSHQLPVDVWNILTTHILVVANLSLYIFSSFFDDVKKRGSTTKIYKNGALAWFGGADVTRFFSCRSDQRCVESSRDFGVSFSEGGKVRPGLNHFGNNYVKNRGDYIN